MNASPPSETGIAERMGFRPGMIVMEIAYDEDVDTDLRDAVADCTGEELLDEDTIEVVDVALLWFRVDDGDLTDTLVDSISPLADDGYIWLLTPKRGRDGYVEPSEIAEAASVAGLSQTSIVTVGDGWSAARLVGRRSSGGRK